MTPPPRDGISEQSGSADAHSRDRETRATLAPGLVALLFTDLVGSTDVLDRLGDAAAEMVRRRHFELLREAVADSGGQEVKSLGDGLMVVFGSAVEAVGCAVAVQEAIERHNRRAAGEPLRVRVGVHVGEPVQDEHDYFGTAVVVARRLCDLAAGGQILASELVRGLVGPRGQHVFRPLGRLPVKGLRERVTAFEVDWGHETPPAPPVRPRRAARSAPAGVLRTRLLPPRPPADALDRPELRARLLDGLAGRLVAVVAGAGYGKTTLLAQTLAAAPNTWVWLSCDERIGGARAFLAHLAAGLEERFAGVGSRLGFEGSVEEQVAELCNEVVATVVDDFVLALDDVHTLSGRPAARALGLLVRDLPPNAHLALASRAALPFPLARLRTSGVLELGEPALALTEEEARDLLEAAAPSLSADVVTELHRRTEGWIAGLLLAAQSRSALGATASSTGGGAQFDYLAEEVLQHQPAEVQEFLLAAAVLDRFTPALAAAVTGRADAASIILDLERRHLFTIRLSEAAEWYRFHHLFRTFLRRRAAGLGGSADLHRRAAAGWLELGEPTEAVRHLLEAGHHVAAVDVLEPLAEAMVTTPEAESLAGWLEAIPAELLLERPGLMLAHGTLLLGRGELEAAFAELERAIEGLLDAGDHERATVALFRLLQNLVAAGISPTRRIEVAERFIPRLPPGSRMLPAARLTLAMGYGFACRFADAEAELQTAVRSPAAGAFPALGVYADLLRAFYVEYPRGRGEAALGVLDDAIAVLERRQRDDPLAFLVYARLYRTYVLYDLGRHEQVLAESARVIEVAERRGMGRVPMRQLLWARLGVLAALGRWSELETELAVAPPLVTDSAPTHLAYRYRGPRALLAAHKGDQLTVTRLVAEARTAMRAHGPGFDQPMFLGDFALAAWTVGLGELARDLADEALIGARSLDLPWGWARSALIAALVWGDGPEGGERLAEALELTARGDYVGLWVERERPRAARLLARAIAQRLGPAGLAPRLLAACGGEVLAKGVELLASASFETRAEVAEATAEASDVDPAVLRRLLRDSHPDVRRAAELARARWADRPRPALRIVTLGSFSVLRGGQLVRELSSGRHRRRTLLAVLVSATAPVHREVLIEWLWPHLSPARARASLHSTLHELRQLVEPHLERAAPSPLIETDGETYRLRLGDEDELDVSTFLARVEAAARAGSLEMRLERLLAAEASYGGPWLPEWPYEEWAAGRRMEVERAHEGVLEQLAEALAEAGQKAAAIGRYERLLGLNPEREGWHRALMRLYAQAGERALALRQYHACRATLRERLGVEPSQETRALYRTLL